MNLIETLLSYYFTILFKYLRINRIALKILYVLHHLWFVFRFWWNLLHRWWITLYITICEKINTLTLLLFSCIFWLTKYLQYWDCLTLLHFSIIISWSFLNEIFICTDFVVFWRRYCRLWITFYNAALLTYWLLYFGCHFVYNIAGYFTYLIHWIII